MTLYGRYRRLKTDFSPLGLIRGEEKSGYFCTPKGAEVIGWTGTDGVHACFVRQFGEMVFAVGPMNPQGEYVHPVAESFEDFLRLLLSCGSLDVLEQLWAWDRPAFDRFLRENPFDPGQRAALDVLREKFALTPMEDPFAYVKDLQSRFDVSRLPRRPDYGDWAPEPEKAPPWRVYYGGGFWERAPGRRRPGREIPIGKAFHWGKGRFYVPAAYSCGAGLAADLCMAADPTAVRGFLAKWEKREEGGPLSQEEREQMEWENPLTWDFRMELSVNGKEMKPDHGSSVVWLPEFCRSGRPADPEAENVVSHYGLDPEQCWLIVRGCYPWPGRRRVEVRSLEVSMVGLPSVFPGPHFTVPKEKTVKFTHPFTGREHTLTVESWKREKLDWDRARQEEMELPAEYSVLEYSLSPELPEDSFALRDCAEGDRPRIRQEPAFGPVSTAAASVGIIGGSDGPVAVTLLKDGGNSRLRAVCSSLHFRSAGRVEWRMAFLEKRRENAKITLL